MMTPPEVPAAFFGPGACAELVQGGLSAMKIRVPGLRAQIDDEAKALIYAMDAEVGALSYKIAAIQRARNAISLATAEVLSLTSQPAPWGQVKSAEKKFREVCLEAADLVFDTEPGVEHTLERDFSAQWTRSQGATQ